MKVCFLLTNISSGGIGRASTIIMNCLSCEGVEVKALLYSKNDTPCSYVLDKRIDVEFLLNKKVSMKKALLFHSLSKKIHQYIVSNKNDILVACGELYFLAAIIACHSTKTKLLCWDHTAPDIATDFVCQRYLKKILLKYSDFNLFLTKASLSHYNSIVDKRKNFQIYNAIDPELQKHNVKYDPSAKRILSVGRLVYQKNFSRLLDIANVVLKRYTDWQWDIYGDGPEKEVLIKKSDSLGLSNNVHFLGNVSNVYDLYNDYSMIVMTSRYEGFPMTLLEASFFGLPMIAFDVSTGPNEIIKDGFNGYLCRASDDDQMVKSIEKMILNQDLRDQLSISSKETSYSFSVANIMPLWHKMFEYILSKG